MSKPLPTHKFYHCTPRRLLIGEILGGGVEHGYMCEPYLDQVFMNTSPIPHYTIQDKVMGDTPGVWHVYEVAPLGRVWIPCEWDEAVTERARVVRYIGKAKGILQHARAQAKDGYPRDDRVKEDASAHGVEVRHTYHNWRAGYNKRRT